MTVHAKLPCGGHHSGASGPACHKRSAGVNGTPAIVGSFPIPSRGDGKIFGKGHQKDGRCYLKSTCNYLYGIKPRVMIRCEHLGDAGWRPLATASQFRLSPLAGRQLTPDVCYEHFSSGHVFHASYCMIFPIPVNGAMMEGGRCLRPHAAPGPRGAGHLPRLPKLRLPD